MGRSLAVVLGAFVVGAAVPAASATTSPVPVFTDAHLSLNVWRSGSSLCFRYDALGSFGHGCSPFRTGQRLEILWARLGRSGSLAFGVTSTRSQKITVKLPGGRQVAGRVRRAPSSLAMPVKLFAVYVPPTAAVKGPATRLVAVASDAQGHVLARVTF